MDRIIIGTILISPVLWIASILLTKEWKHFKKLVLINSALIICYLIVINFINWIHLGNDEYGLKIMTLNISLIVFHILLGFISSVIIYRKMKKGL